MKKYKHIPSGKIIEIVGTLVISKQAVNGRISIQELLNGNDWKEYEEIKAEDGVITDVTKGWWYVIDDALEKGAKFTNTTVYKDKFNTPQEKIKRFLKEENAKEYIDKHLPVMKSAEGKNIFKGDSVWVVYLFGGNCSKKAALLTVRENFKANFLENCLIFKYEANAKIYILENNLVISLKDIANEYNNSKDLSEFLNKITELSKKKLK